MIEVDEDGSLFCILDGMKTINVRAQGGQNPKRYWVEIPPADAFRMNQALGRSIAGMQATVLIYLRGGKK